MTTTQIGIAKYHTVEEWYRDMKAQGFFIPLALCYDLRQLIETKGITFADAYATLLQQNRIILMDEVFIYSMQ